MQNTNNEQSPSLDPLVRRGLAALSAGTERVKLMDGLWLSQTCDGWLAVHGAEYDSLKGYACNLETRAHAERLRDALTVVLSAQNAKLSHEEGGKEQL